MNKLHIITLILIGLIFSNCKKEENEIEITINYELLNDISPVKVILSVDEKLSWSEWFVGENIIYRPKDKNYIDHIFDIEDNSKIKLNAIGFNDEKYFGNLEIDIPPIAEKLIIFGYFFENIPDYSILEDTINLVFEYFNGYDSLNFQKMIPKITFEINDSLIFDSTIIIEELGFGPLNQVRHTFNFWIKGNNSSTIYFHEEILLKNDYYLYTGDTPNHLELENTIGDNSEKIYLITDWTR